MHFRLRDGIGEMELRYLSEEVDRHGNVRVYFRRKGRRVRLRETPGTDAFLAEYRAAARGITKPNATDARSFSWLLEGYYDSAEFKRLKNIREQHGDKPYALMQARHIRLLRDEKAETPEAANARVKALRQVYGWAKEMGYTSSNPAKDVPYIKSDSEGFHTWAIGEVEQYENRHPVGTKARLALDLLLYTGVRRSDVVKLGRQMEREGFLRFTETKGRDRKIKQRSITILPVLRASIDATPSGHMTYLVTEFGKPFTHGGFGNWFKRRCREAELPHCSAHGLRKTGATMAAERGATEHQLMALYGWESPKQAAGYTRKVNREKLATEGLRFLDPGERKLDARVSPGTIDVVSPENVQGKTVA
jgi:integrase